MPRGRYSPSRQAGVTYLWMLFLVFLLGLGLGKAVEIQSLVSQRAKEADLLYIGTAYRDAIESYYLSALDGNRRYPASLDVLLKDPRYPATKRHLRKLYLDPITRTPFALVYSPEGGISGVRSTSEKTPIKQAGFASDDQGFQGAKKYQDWQFVYVGAAPVIVNGMRL